jgi:predicted nucleic acid-binding protein
MQRIIVSDTSCLILLKKINKLNILNLLFGKIIITQKVAEEFGDALPNYFEIINPLDNKYCNILENFLDAGEASSIALALEYENCLLIIDELKGRKEAIMLGLNITGTIGVLILAKQKGLITSLKDVIYEIENTSFRISKKLLFNALEIVGES